MDKDKVAHLIWGNCAHDTCGARGRISACNSRTRRARNPPVGSLLVCSAPRAPETPWLRTRAGPAMHTC
eukprot:3963190-Pyramimonas_sp.AAC.1